MHKLSSTCIRKAQMAATRPGICQVSRKRLPSLGMSAGAAYENCNQAAVPMLTVRSWRLKLKLSQKLLSEAWALHILAFHSHKLLGADLLASTLPACTNYQIIRLVNTTGCESGAAATVNYSSWSSSKAANAVLRSGTCKASARMRKCRFSC